MTLREQARLALIGAGDQPWGLDVIEMEAARAGVQLPSPVASGLVNGLPFVVVKKTAQNVGQLWGNEGDSLEVWPYATNETWQALDALCGIAVMRLNHQILSDDDGAAYRLNYIGSPLQDTVRDEWDAYTRPLRFDSTALRWLVPTHPLAVAMQTWTAAKWPGQVLTNPATWVPTQTVPGIYWRVSDMPRVRDAVDHFPWMDVKRATLVGHVITGNYDAIQTWVGRIAGAVPRATIAFGTGYLTEHEVIRADPNADQDVDGQITVEVMYAEATDDYVSLTMPYDPSVPGQGAAPLERIITHGGDVPTETDRT